MKDRIELLLKAKNITAKQFAEEIGVQPSRMSHILSGRNNPNIDFAIKLVNRYPEVNLQWLIMGTGEMYVATPSAEPTTSSPTNTQQQFVSMEPQPTQVGQMPMNQPQPMEPQPTQVGQMPMNQPQPMEPHPTQIGQMPMNQQQPIQAQPTQVRQMPINQQQVVSPQDATPIATPVPRAVTQPEIKVGESYDLFAGYDFDNLEDPPPVTTSEESSQERTDVVNVIGDNAENTLGNNVANTLEDTAQNANEHMIVNANTLEDNMENAAEYHMEQPTENTAADAMMSAHSETQERSRMDYQRNLREISAASIARNYRQRIDNNSFTDEEEGMPEQVTMPQKHERRITKIIVVYDDHTFAEFLP